MFLASLRACSFGHPRRRNFTHYTSFLRLLSSVSLELCSSLRTSTSLKERVQLLLSRRCRTGVNSDRITCPSVLRFQQFATSLSLALTHWFSWHVSPGVYALHITHTQRWLIKVSAKAPWKVAPRIIAPAIWQTQHEQSFPLFFFRSSRFSHLACYLIFLASLFGALFAVCVAEIVFYLRLPARVRERERGRNARIARQLQSQFHGGFEGDEGCLFQVAPSNVNLQILTSKCCSGHSKLLGGTFLCFSTTNIGPGERWVGECESGSGWS